jgi:HPt (histidine-containing phosphotransfer) domain-containing protein
MARKQPIELFMPPNTLKAKVGRGSLDMAAAIRRAETAVQELKGEFRGWAAEDMQRLTAARDQYAKKPNAAARAGLIRAAHDLRGQAASFELPLIARIAASLSRLLNETQADTDLPPGLVDAHVDAVQVIFRQNISDEKNDVARLLCAELDARVSEALIRKT